MFIALCKIKVIVLVDKNVLQKNIYSLESPEICDDFYTTLKSKQKSVYNLEVIINIKTEFTPGTF